ncbi:MAG: DUF3575 domain-containing protein [Bacteroidetes bacterium]|nr:DUF3575 domain-containing protein [Bacteroidota bacterium]
MKQYILIIAVLATVSIPLHSKAQGVAVGGETGFSLFAGSGANLQIPIGANVEWGINTNLSLVGRISFDIGLGVGHYNTLYISPEVRYHFSEVFDGAYVGGFMGIGPSSFNSFYFGIGAVGGYEIPLTEHFNMDISGQLGMGNVGNSLGRVTGLHFRPTVALRYQF